MKVLLAILLLASTAHADDDRLANRETMIAGFGLVSMQVDGIANSGMAVQPTLTRTFDRFELQVEYLLADLRDDSMRQPGSILHRLGFSGRYQAARARVDRSMTLDFVVEGGVGLQYLERDDGDVIGRNDLSLGFGLRMLSNVTHGRRAFMGLEAMFRGLVTPSGDKAFVFVFGVPFGR